MRALICNTFFMIILSTSQAQVSPPLDMQKPMTELEIGQMYLTKGKTQTKNGFIMLGIGIVMGTTGALVMSNSAFDKGFGTGAGVFLAGAACTLISIPLFISGGNNKHKANIILSRNKSPISAGQGNSQRLFSVGVGTMINN